MFTVIIAQKEYIDSMHDYELFVKPFRQKKNFAICEWKTDETESLAASVPDLAKTVSGLDSWRAVIIVPEDGLNKQNPFELVEYTAPERPQALYMTQEEAKSYYDSVYEAKNACFEEASQKALTMLAARLCRDPLLSHDTEASAATTAELKHGYEDEEDDTPRMADIEFMEYREYRRESLRKNELRKQIRGGEKVAFIFPKEVICVAKRTMKTAEMQISTGWNMHMEQKYSRFYDWNMYYDKMRYLVYDICRRDREYYAFEQLKFLCTVLLLATNETPQGALSPNRVYEMKSDTDIAELQEFINVYDKKLMLTEDYLQTEISKVRTKNSRHMTDDEAERVFCANINIPVTADSSVDRESLFFRKEIGLASDTPEDELTVWQTDFKAGVKEMRKLLKQPRRAVKRSVTELRGLNEFSDDRVVTLTEIQTEDIMEHADDEEKKMIGISKLGMRDDEYFEKEMQKAGAEVEHEMGRRMTRNLIIIMCSIFMGAMAISILPMFFMNHATAAAVSSSAVIMLAALAIFAATLLIILIALRGRLKEVIRNYNNRVTDLSNEIYSNLSLCSKYLSNVCNIMRAKSVLNSYEQQKNPQKSKIAIFEKHISDIEEKRAGVKDIFGKFFEIDDQTDVAALSPYTYNFEEPKDYDYPIPINKDRENTIEFMQRGNNVVVPLKFISRISIKREELYD